MNKQKAIIVDLDGVLSDDSRRRHFIRENKEWLWSNGWKPHVGILDGNWRPDGWYPEKNDPMHGSNGKWQPDWEAYDAVASGDSVNDSINTILRVLDPYYRSIILTDRPEKYRKPTEEWLNKNFSSIRWDLFMRPDFLPCVCTHSIEGGINGPVCCGNPDNRPAAEVKREIYEGEIAGKYEVLFCLERDEDCCTMWRGLGLQVLRVM